VTTLEAPLIDVAAGPKADDDRLSPPERGTTTIAPRVFERLAAVAAAEDPEVEGAVQTGVGRFLPWTEALPAEAAADVDDDGVILDLTFNVAYPQSVRQVTERVRRHVADRVGSLTGRRVREINITVPDLVVPRRSRARVR
jgi:uncharacterized alkaline shock family protein YloU